MGNWNPKVEQVKRPKPLTVKQAGLKGLDVDIETRRKHGSMVDDFDVQGTDDKTFSLKSYVNTMLRAHAMATKAGRDAVTASTHDELTMLKEMQAAILQEFKVDIFPQVKVAKEPKDRKFLRINDLLTAKSA